MIICTLKKKMKKGQAQQAPDQEAEVKKKRLLNMISMIFKVRAPNNSKWA